MMCHLSALHANAELQADHILPGSIYTAFQQWGTLEQECFED